MLNYISVNLCLWRGDLNLSVATNSQSICDIIAFCRGYKWPPSVSASTADNYHSPQHLDITPRLHWTCFYTGRQRQAKVWSLWRVVTFWTKRSNALSDLCVSFTDFSGALACRSLSLCPSRSWFWSLQLLVLFTTDWSQTINHLVSIFLYIDDLSVSERKWFKNIHNVMLFCLCRHVWRNSVWLSETRGPGKH